MKTSQGKSFVRDSILVFSGGPGESWIEELDEYDVLRLCACVYSFYYINQPVDKPQLRSIRYIKVLMLRYKSNVK